MPDPIINQAFCTNIGPMENIPNNFRGSLFSFSFRFLQRTVLANECDCTGAKHIQAILTLFDRTKKDLSLAFSWDDYFLAFYRGIRISFRHDVLADSSLRGE